MRNTRNRGDVLHRCVRGVELLEARRLLSGVPGVNFFTGSDLATPGLTASFVNTSLRDYLPLTDWRVSQPVSGTRVDTQFSFVTDNWGSRASVGVMSGSDSDWDNFSVQWDGVIQVTQAGQRLTTYSDDGSRFWIDMDNDGFEDSELFDNNYGRDQGTTGGDRSDLLPAGTFPFRVQYYEGGGGNEFHIRSSPWVPRQFVAAADNPKQTIKVLVLNFEPRVPSEGNKRMWEVFGWNDPRRLARQFASDIKWMTGGAVEVQFVEQRHLDAFPTFHDGFRYDPDTYVQNRRTNTNWSTSTADFARLSAEQNLPALVNSGAIDEIWTFGDHFFSLFGEAWMAGPNSFFINGPSFTDIGFDRAIAGYGFNYERGVAEMLHNLSHRTENHGQRAFGNWNLANPTTAFDRFSANYLDSPGQTAGVGTCHVPANADGHYDYGDPRTVTSAAFDFANYPNLTGATTSVSRETWQVGPEYANDFQRDYMLFYFGMMPRNAGTATDGRQANWFKYIWDFNSYEATTGLRRQEDAFASAGPISRASTTPLDFTVRYYDVTGVNTTSLDNSDVVIVSPSGTSTSVARMITGSQVATTTGTARTVTYRFNAPGGSWDITDNGRYSIRQQASQVRDTLGNNFPSGEIGSFQVSIVDPATMPIAAWLADGTATATHTTLDIGSIGDLFDGNVSSLIRTPNIDPAVVTLDLGTARTIHGARAYFSYASGNPAYQWQLETADSLADLDSRTGTYRLAVPLTGTASDRYSSVNLATPISARFARLTATRLTGDNYVHINEFALVGPPVTDTTPPVATLVPGGVITTAGGTNRFVSLNVTDNLAVEVDSLRTGDVVVTGPGGFTTSPVFHSVSSHIDGSPRTVNYWFIPPGGTWDLTDNGTYTVSLLAGEITDTFGNAAPGGVLGTFSVAIPAPLTVVPTDFAENLDIPWTAAAEGATASATFDTTRVRYGSRSVRLDTTGGFDVYARTDPPHGATWDFGDYPSVQFSVYASNPSPFGFQSSPTLVLHSASGGSYTYTYVSGGVPQPIFNAALNQWADFSVPIRKSPNPGLQNGWRMSVSGTPRLSDITGIEIHADTWDAGFTLWIDRVMVRSDKMDRPRPAPPPMATTARASAGGLFSAQTVRPLGEPLPKLWDEPEGDLAQTDVLDRR